MAQIPLGNFGQAVARPGPAVAIPQDNPIGEATGRTLGVAQGIATDMAERQTRLDLAAADEQRRKDEEARHAAIRAQTITTLAGTKDALADLHDQITQGIADGYDRLKDFSRGQPVSRDALHAFIRTLELPEAERQRLLELTPERYLGLAARLARGET